MARNNTQLTARIENELANLTADQVIKTYSGQVYACTCGCKGNYSESKAAKTRMINFLRANAANVNVISVFDGLIYFIDTETRTKAIYTNVK